MNLAQELIKKFERIGQAHVFNKFEKLSSKDQLDFLERANSIDLEHLKRLINKAKFHDLEAKIHSNLMGVNDLLKSAGHTHVNSYKDLVERGERAIREGRVSALLVAGGDGTRLGFMGPKGMHPVTLIKKKSLFQIFSEQIQVIQKRYGTIVPWYIMTSDSNHESTREFFVNNNNFGLAEVHFFKQGLCPVIDFEGKLMLEPKGLIAMAPDGHGGCLKALASNGLLEKMEKSGKDIISYFQVDNPLVKCIDPFFIGLHIASDAEMSCKVVRKRNPEERVGIFCLEERIIKVVEYTHVSKEMLEKKDSYGNLIYSAGNAGVHLMDREFVRRMNDFGKMNLYQTRKKMPYIDPEQSIVIPEEPNAFKFEQLIFDILPEARNVVLMEIVREEEFSPIKNAQGTDSLESFKKSQLSQYVEWFKKVGIEIPCGEDGIPLFNIEISPFFADNQYSFIEKWESLLEKPEILKEIYLE